MVHAWASKNISIRPKTGKVANVILATGDGGDDDDDDGEEFLVEEKAKDDLDLLTEAPTAQTDVNMHTTFNGWFFFAIRFSFFATIV